MANCCVQQKDAGFDVLLTADKGFAHQQNLKGFKIALVILGQGQWPSIKPAVAGNTTRLGTGPLPLEESICGASDLQLPSPHEDPGFQSFP